MKTLFLLGDSTCAIKDEKSRPETGWGEMFSPYMKEDWSLVNLAKNGSSTESILLEGIFYNCFWRSSEGDYVIIQFGHNENKPEAYRRTTPYGKYAFNLRYFIDNFKKKGVKPILISSIARRNFVNGEIQDTHFGYPEAMEMVAKEKSVPFAELSKRTLKLLGEMGDDRSKALFMNFEAGLYENYPEGKEDNTHLRPEGAAFIAALIAEELKKFDLPFLK